METNLLDRMLNSYLTEQTPVIITLQNKIRVSGKLRAFDSYVIIMEGVKREIVFRHAVSSLAPQVQEEHKRPAAPSRSAHLNAKTFPKPVKTAFNKPGTAPRAQPQPMLSASPSEANLNTSMKDGLLRWMQEQKAAK